MPDQVAAYGLVFSGVVFPNRFLTPQFGWPEWHIDVEIIGDAPVPEAAWGPNLSVFHNIPSGAVVSHRLDRRSRLLQPSYPPTEAFAHPLLGYPSLAANAWLGRPCFHAGAFVLDGRAWIVAGDRAAGKSSMLGWLAAHGIVVLSDDLAVVDDDRVFAGPRCIDLRESAAAHFGVGEDVGIIGSRRRWRVALPSCPPSVPLGGWVWPQWGEEADVRVLGVAEKLAAFAGARAFFSDNPDHRHILSLLSLPAYEFSRPRDFDKLDAVMDLLTTTLGRHAHS